MAQQSTALKYQEDDIDYERFITEDDEPVDNLLAAKQMYLLVDPLYSSWKPGRSFMACPDVGVFYDVSKPGIAPDMFLSMDVNPPEDLMKKKNRSYFVWRYGKPPEIAVEIVSPTDGGELDKKPDIYAEIGVLYYIVYDPGKFIMKDLLRIYRLQNGEYHLYPKRIFPEIGLGVMLWKGIYEDANATWMRWCDMEGRLILTGKENSVLERERAEKERRLKDQERQRADQERQRADQEFQRAEQERRRADQLEAQLRALGILPDKPS